MKIRQSIFVPYQMRTLKIGSNNRKLVELIMFNNKETVLKYFALFISVFNLDTF